MRTSYNSIASSFLHFLLPKMNRKKMGKEEKLSSVCVEKNGSRQLSATTKASVGDIFCLITILLRFTLPDRTEEELESLSKYYSELEKTKKAPVHAKGRRAEVDSAKEQETSTVITFSYENHELSWA